MAWCMSIAILLVASVHAVPIDKIKMLSSTGHSQTVENTVPSEVKLPEETQPKAEMKLEVKAQQSEQETTGLPSSEGGTDDLRIYIYDDKLAHGVYPDESMYTPDKCKSWDNGKRFCWHELGLLQMFTHTFLASARVHDPSAANVFLVPVFPNLGGLDCYQNHMPYAIDTFYDVTSKLHETPTWNGGKNHFFLFASADRGICECATKWTYDRSKFGQMGWIELFSDTDMPRAAECFNPERDVVIPPQLESFGAEHQLPARSGSNKFHMNALTLLKTGKAASGQEMIGFTKADQSMTNQNGIMVPPVQMTQVNINEAEAGLQDHNSILIYWRGDVTTNPIRTELVNEFANKPDCVVSGDKADAATHEKEINSARFCLVPPGKASWSFRLAEVLEIGCLPVILRADKQKMPFSGSVDWNSFAVLVDDSDTANVYDRVKSISMEQELKLHSALQAEAPKLKMTNKEEFARALAYELNKVRKT